MNLTLQIVLITVTICVFLYIVTSIRRSNVKIDYTFFWIVLSVVMIIVSIFPDIGIWGAKLFGFATPFHFVITVGFFFLCYKVFTLALQMSKMKDQIEKLTQTIAIREMEWIEERNRIENKTVKKTVKKSASTGKQASKKTKSKKTASTKK